MWLCLGLFWVISQDLAKLKSFYLLQGLFYLLQAANEETLHSFMGVTQPAWGSYKVARWFGFTRVYADASIWDTNTIYLRGKNWNCRQRGRLFFSDPITCFLLTSSLTENVGTTSCAVLHSWDWKIRGRKLFHPPLRASEGNKCDRNQVMFCSSRRGVVREILESSITWWQQKCSYLHSDISYSF